MIPISVVIPTWNPGPELAETIRSIEEKVAEVIVVDDCSDTDPAHMVWEVRPGTIVVRSRERLGGVGNWNRAVGLARADLVHVLHQDDRVMPGFYEEIWAMAQRYPDCALYATRAWCGPARTLTYEIPGMTEPTNDPTPFLYWNPVETPAVVTRREFHTNHSGFRQDLAYTPDWEMWARAVKYGRGIWSEKPLAWFSPAPSVSWSWRLIESGDALREMWKLAGYLAELTPAFDRKQFFTNAAFRAGLFVAALTKAGKTDAAQVNREIRVELEKEAA